MSDKKNKKGSASKPSPANSDRDDVPAELRAKVASLVLDAFFIKYPLPEIPDARPASLRRTVKEDNILVSAEDRVWVDGLVSMSWEDFGTVAGPSKSALINPSWSPQRGAVRDAIFGKPAKDFDLATNKGDEDNLDQPSAENLRMFSGTPLEEKLLKANHELRHELSNLKHLINQLKKTWNVAADAAINQKIAEYQITDDE